MAKSKRKTSGDRHSILAVTDAIPTPIVFLDQDLRIESANRAFYETFRISLPAGEERLLCELGDGELNAPELLDVLRRVFLEGTGVEDLQLEHRFPGIGWKALSVSANLVTRAGAAPRLLLAIEDITERTQLESALADEQFRIRTCFEHLPVLAYNIGFDGKILDCNEMS